MVRVASWNIQKGIGMDLRRDLARTARVLSACDYDVIGLQEVVRSEAHDQAALLARVLGMTLAWGPARRLRDGTYGNALLVRGEVREARVHDLSVPRHEPRACLEAVVSTGAHTLRVFVCHFGLGRRERIEQIARLSTILDLAAGDVPRVVLGDFNELGSGAVHRSLDALFPRAPERMRTHPSPLPIFALDRIVWDATLTGSVRVVPVAGASDHRLVCASLQ